MNLNRKIFFDEIKSSLFKRGLNQSQVDGLDAILDIQKSHYQNMSLPQLAYCLATAYHEVGGRMQPVREGFAKTDQAAINAVKKLHRRGKISYNYARRNPKTGHSYFGRGIVQLTHARNYKKLSKRLGIDFYNHPEKALETDNSIHILFVGCREGLFTGKKLSDYINGKRKNYKAARRIVNGNDRASLIAGYARKFEKALKKAELFSATSKPKKSKTIRAKVKKKNDKKELVKSSRRIQFISRFIRFLEWAGLGVGTWTFNTLETVSDFITDGKTLSFFAGGLIVYLAFHYLKWMSIREYEEGRYQPSQAPNQSGQTQGSD